MEMEESAQKTLERVVSQRALQMGSSFQCQICVVGFLCGVCLTYFFVAALTSFGAVELGGLSFSPPTAEMMSQNSSEGTSFLDIGKSLDRQSTVKETERIMNSQRNYELTDGRVSLLYSTWTSLLKKSIEKESVLMNKVGSSESDVPEAPHLENCKLITDIRERLDKHSENGTNPPWKTWKGSLGLELLHQISADDKQEPHVEYQAKPEGAYPPWIAGSDEDNYPLTRRAQHNLWIHQHPLNCNGPHVRFLVSDWETMPGFGIGAQLAGMCGLLAIAVKEKRVLVTNYFNRADHDGCKGPFRSRWSCYFFPETSTECQNRAFELMKKPEAWKDGIITGKDNYTSKEIWSGRTPRVWGEPWNDLQPTTEINGSLIRSHRKMDRRWWRAQAVRYLMRYQTKYTCDLLNIARHTAFGMQAAKIVAESLGEWPRVIMDKPKSDMEQFVWSSHKPWIPRPMLSMHIRMGDKASEMKVVGFEDYMHLARRIRKRFPDLNSIWLSTEMQEVIDKTRLYPNWNFYYTNVSRQVGNITMASYEASLGRETSTNYPLVNFLMATEADFFIGALGSTWCFLIDGMRNTGGKVMAGYLSVNKDRFW